MRLFVEIAVGVHGPAVPPIDRIAVPLVGAGLRHKINIGSRQASVLAGIAIVHYGRFLDVILAQQQVRSPAVVKVQKGIVLVHTIKRKQI